MAPSPLGLGNLCPIGWAAWGSSSRIPPLPWAPWVWVSSRSLPSPTCSPGALVLPSCLISIMHSDDWFLQHTFLTYSRRWPKKHFKRQLQGKIWRAGLGIWLIQWWLAWDKRVLELHFTSVGMYRANLSWALMLLPNLISKHSLMELQLWSLPTSRRGPLYELFVKLRFIVSHDHNHVN